MIIKLDETTPTEFVVNIKCKSVMYDYPVSNVCARL
jgi:hypothetical protein